MCRHSLLGSTEWRHTDADAGGVVIIIVIVSMVDGGWRLIGLISTLGLNFTLLYFTLLVTLLRQNGNEKSVLLYFYGVNRVITSNYSVYFILCYSGLRSKVNLQKENAS